MAEITLALARVVQLVDDGGTDKSIAASIETDEDAVQALLRQARELRVITKRTAIWPNFAALLATTSHEPDARQLIEARAAGTYWDPPATGDEPETKEAPMQRRRRKELSVDLLQWALEMTTRVAAGEDGALAAMVRKHGLQRGTLTSGLEKIRDMGGTSDLNVSAAKFQLDKPEALLAKLQSGEVKDAGGAADFLKGIESGDLSDQPASEQPEVNRSQASEHKETDTGSEQVKPEVFTETFTDDEVQALKRMASREIGAPMSIQKSPDSEVVRIRCNSAAIAALRDYQKRHKVSLAVALGQAIEYFLAGGEPGASHEA